MGVWEYKTSRVKFRHRACVAICSIGLKWGAEREKEEIVVDSAREGERDRERENSQKAHATVRYDKASVSSRNCYGMTEQCKQTRGAHST